MARKVVVRKLASVALAAGFLAVVSACSADAPTEVDISQGGDCITVNGQLICGPDGP